MGFPDSSVGKGSACNAGDPSSIPGLGRSAGEGIPTPVFLGFPGGSAGEESTYNAGDLAWEDPWKRERLPTPIFWPGEFHGLYSPWGHEELDMTEATKLSDTWETPSILLTTAFFLFPHLLTRGPPKQPPHGLLCLQYSHFLVCYICS